MNSDPGTSAAKIGALEVLNRAGHIVQRIAWDGRTLRIGRAYDNDVIVGDPFVCPHHLELASVDGAPVARDLDSINGTYAGRRVRRVDRWTLQDGQVLHFGHSQLRFHAAGSAVPATVRDTARHGLLGRLASPWSPLLALVLALTALALSELLDTAGQPSWPALAGELVYPLIGVLAWAGFWALLNRVLTHRAHFAVHASIALLGVAGLFAVTQVVSLAGFALGLSASVWWLELIAQVGVLAAVIHAHLRYALHGRSARLAAAATLAALALFGGPATGELLDRQEFSSLPYLDPLLWPPRYRLVEAKSAGTFFEHAGNLRARADEESGR